jgi:hypothetical protein
MAHCRCAPARRRDPACTPGRRVRSAATKPWMARWPLITAQLPSFCTECGSVRTVSAIDTLELISTIVDATKPMTGFCTDCHAPWVLSWTERQEVALKMAGTLRAADGEDG